MCTKLVPQTRGPDHPVARAGQPSGTRDVLTCSIYSHGQLSFIVLGGELDIATAPGLVRRLVPVAETGGYLLLDLAGVNFCDCSGLSVFLRLRRRAISAGGSLCLTAPTAAIRRLIVTTRLHDLLPIAAGPAEVVTALSRDAATAPPHPPLHEIDIERLRAGAVRAVSVAW
jgi:anti-sigma B factor antagonist